MRKNIIIILLVIFILSIGSYAQAAPLEVSAQSAILIDQNSGRVLFAKNIDEKRPMASITKIMTAIVALEHGELEDIVRASPEASSTGGSSIWLDAGEEKTLEELLYGLMLRSGNDAAVAIAEHISGSVDEFALLMTETAVEIGAINTIFKNPHGLDHEEHYTTAYDYALITRRALNNDTFKKIIATEEKRISWPGSNWNRMLRNQNKLLEKYEGGDGVKTGWTTPAGKCFVGSATRDDWQLISVVLNAPRMWEDTIEMLDYGFNYYKPGKIAVENQHIRSIVVENAPQETLKAILSESVYLPLAREVEEKVELKYEIKSEFTLPINKGTEVGHLVTYINNEKIMEVPLLAGESLKEDSLLERIMRPFRVFAARFI